MKITEYKILYAIAGAAVASALLLGFWLWTQTYVQQEFLFHSHIESEEFKEEIRLTIQDEVYKMQTNLKGIK